MKKIVKVKRQITKTELTKISVEDLTDQDVWSLTYQELISAFTTLQKIYKDIYFQNKELENKLTCRIEAVKRLEAEIESSKPIREYTGYSDTQGDPFAG